MKRKFSVRVFGAQLSPGGNYVKQGYRDFDEFEEDSPTGGCIAIRKAFKKAEQLRMFRPSHEISCDIYPLPTGCEEKS